MEKLNPKLLHLRDLSSKNTINTQLKIDNSEKEIIQNGKDKQDEINNTDLKGKKELLQNPFKLNKGAKIKRILEDNKTINSNTNSNIEKNSKEIKEIKDIEIINCNSETEAKVVDAISKKSLASESDLTMLIKINSSSYNIKKIVKRDFFTITALELAPNLLGKIIKRTITDEKSSSKIDLFYKIVETEAYMAPEDKACHAYNNKKTEKTKYFWTIGGSIYVFNIYMPQNVCFNIISSDENTPHGVLIRAIEPLNIETIKYVIENRNKKIDIMQINFEKQKKNVIDLFNGPAKAGMSMFIDKSFNSVDLLSSESISLWEMNENEEIGKTNKNLNDSDIVESKRINIDYAAEYKDKLWRFHIKDNKYVSIGK